MKGKTANRGERVAREEREEDEVRLARALGHHLRVAILECINSYGPMAATEVARKVGAELSNLSYHVRVLAKAGLIEEVGQEPGLCGRPKTTYRATARALLHDEAWSSLSPTTRAGISATMFGVMATRVSDAFQADTFDSRTADTSASRPLPSTRMDGMR